MNECREGGAEVKMGVQKLSKMGIGLRELNRVGSWVKPVDMYIKAVGHKTCIFPFRFSLYLSSLSKFLCSLSYLQWRFPAVADYPTRWLAGLSGGATASDLKGSYFLIFS
jgi:hypothetical protein